MKAISFSRAAVDAFIIPNKIGTIGGLLMNKEEILGLMKRVDPTASDETQLVQLWYKSEELKSDNLQDHYFRVDGGDMEFTGRVTCSFLPATLFEGLKEGDTVDTTLRVVMDLNRVEGEEPWQELDFPVRLRLSQREGRYRAFGDFEEVLAKVTA